MQEEASYRERATNLLLKKDDRTSVQMFRYLFVAVAAFSCDFILLVTLTELADLHYLLAAALGFSGGLAVNYVLSVRWVFGERAFASRRLEFLAFATIGIIGLIMTAGLMWLMTGLLGVYYILSKLIVTAVVFFWNFLARKFLLFNNSSNDKK